MGSITVGQMVKTARMKKGLTQKELAIEIYKIDEGDTRQILNKSMFISGIERDSEFLPTAIVLDMADFLEIPVKELIDGKVESYRVKLVKALTPKSK